MEMLIAYFVVALPFILSFVNLFYFVRILIKKNEKHYVKFFELSGIFISILYIVFIAAFNPTWFSSSWDEQLINAEKHGIISPDHAATVAVLLAVAFAGYLVLRFVPARRMSPVVSVLSIAAVYLGMVVFVLWNIQAYKEITFYLVTANYVILFIKSIYITVCERNALFREGIASTKFKKLSRLLDRGTNLPWLALFFAIPLLGIIIAVLCLFGQEPNSIIKAWTETADWTMSQKIPPQNIQRDNHYLCTVAAGGHRRAVKPLRTGIRHGRRIVVNRQLCIANAFEQVIQEKTPRFHKAVRAFYDRTGYPISKHIRSKYTADIIYFLMKPLEWFFLIVLYTIDQNPEDRIAVQYPHKPLPKA